MSQTAHEDPERGNADGNQNQPLNQPGPNQPLQSLQGESSFGDSSGPFFSIYSKVAEEEDRKMVERWQKDADGILIFTGLFSAAVAALLAVTVLDLRPSSQDTAAFYLGNIYGVLADPNVTRASIPFPAKPPPFSPPTHAVWVNSLWFLSLVMSLSCALWATSLQQWARRYIRLTQPARCSPEKRARIRAFFSNGVDNMHIPWAVEGLPTLLHLSLFLFFGGVVIFLFNVDQGVFICVVSWIGLFSVVYGLITLLPSMRHYSPYSAPLSIPAWFLCFSTQFVTFKVLALVTDSYGFYQTLDRCNNLSGRYRRWMFGGVEKAAEEMTEEQSSEIDVRILGWTISALGDDDLLEKFFEAIPGFFNSRLVKRLKRDFPVTLLKTFWGALGGFMGRTLSSNSVTESVKSRRVIICRDIMSQIPCPKNYMPDNLRSHFDQAPVSIERSQAMAQWFTHTSRNVSYAARARVAKNLPRIQECDGRWIALARNVYGLSEGDLQHDVALGRDNVLLATLIDVSRRAVRSHEWQLVGALTEFDMCHTLPGLQHDFCTLWDEIVQEARNQGHYTTPVYILRDIRHLYITLHQHTNAAPTAFSASTDDSDPILSQPSSYPVCGIASHRRGSTAHVPDPNSRAQWSLLTQPSGSHNTSPHYSTSGGSTVSRQVKEVIVAGPPFPSDPTILSKIGDSSQALAATSPALPVYISPRPTDAVADALPAIPPAAILSHPLEGTTQRDMVPPCAKLDINEILSTELTPATSTPLSTPVSAPSVLNETSPWDAGPASTSNSLLPALSIVGFSIPDSRPPSRDSPLKLASLITLSGTTPFHLINTDMLPRLRARGLVNSRNNCFANAVLQLLVHCPPFWNLFRDLGRLMGQRGLGEGQETGSDATPLVDAKVKFLGEFVYKEDLSATRQLQQKAARGKTRENEEEKKGHDVVDSFDPRYMYDAMKEKRQLKHLQDGQQHDSEEFLNLYLDALDEELVQVCAYISTYKPVSAPSVEGLVEGEAQSAEGQTDVGQRGFTASLMESPISQVFGGRSRSTVCIPNQPDTITIQDWRLLRLNVQPDSVHTIRDALALAHVLQPQLPQVGESSSMEASKQVLFESLPPVLVLHLGCSMDDAAVDGIVKITKAIQLAPELEIPLEIMAPVSGRSAEPVPVHYKLYGVLYHHGESTGSGHYTVDVLHPSGVDGSGEAWLHIDDEAVSTVRHEDMFGGHDNERVDDQCAYMLLYCRTAPTQT